jgi:peptidoglycan hydrolase-like protein with peptidoglycan-binding domain
MIPRRMNRLLLAAPLALFALAAQAQPATAPQGPLTYTQALTPDAVRIIQQKLHESGVYAGAIDGNWGADSQQALANFQQTRGLQITGTINLATAATLGVSPVELVGAGQGGSAPTAAAAPPPPAETPAPSATPAPATPPRGPVALTHDAIRLVQAHLRENGFYYGAIDGAWGASSQAALVRMQQTKGIPVTGRIDAASVQAIGLDPNNFPPR